MTYIQSIRDAGGVINTFIVMAAGMGMLEHKDPSSLACNGGHILVGPSTFWESCSRNIPDSLIINWDQTGINYVPVSQWTMAKEGSKRVAIAGQNDKRQITAVFAASLSGNFLPLQLVYQGKTPKCLPTVTFPSKWHVTATPNHWCNEKTSLDYVEKIIVPYIIDKKTELGLPSTYSSLVIKPSIQYIIITMVEVNSAVNG